MQRSRRLIIAVLAGATLLGTGGIAQAMSDGFYTPEKQRCDETHNDTANEDVPHDSTERCQNATLFVANGDHEIARAGTLHTQGGQFVRNYQVDGDLGQAPAPQDGAQVYFGADDNLDRGEHDGSSGIGNGPSDGGGIELLLDPASFGEWIARVQDGDTAFLLTNPLPLISFGTGACADGICFAVTTHQRVAYQGAGSGSRDSADYSGVGWDPESCGGPSQTAATCDDPNASGDQDITYWNNKVGTVYNEPGVQVYEDPDPEGSPIGPYPLPGAYAGTCGVVVSPTGDQDPIDARHGGCDGSLAP